MKGGDKMDILAARSFRVFLAVTLAANCCLPCYTLAYADQPTYGGANYEQLRKNQPERSGDGQVDQGADFQGLLRREAPEEASSGSELLSLAGAGRVRPSAHVLVETSYSLADSLIRLSSARAYADESQGVESVSQEEQEEIDGDAGGLELSSGVGESISYAADGGAAGEGHGPDDGAAEGAGEDTTSDNGAVVDPVVYDVDPSPDYPLLEEGDGSFDDSFGGSLADDYLVADYGVSPLAIGAGTVIDTLIASSVTGSWTGHAIGNYSWTAREGTLYNLVSILLEQVNNRLSSVQSNQTYANNYLKAIDSSGKSSVTELTSILAYAKWVYSLSQKQWGYGYGGTVVIESGSPMDLLGKVQRNSDYVTSLYGLIQKQWGYGFGGTVVTEKGSPFDLLGKIQRNSDYITSLDSRASIANDLLGKIQRNSDYITSLDNRVSGIVQIFADQYDLTGKIQRNTDYITSVHSILDVITKGPEGGRVSLYSIGNSIETIKNETRDLDNLLEDANTWLVSIHDRLSALDALGVRLANIALTTDEIKKGVNSSLQWYDILHGDLSMLRHGAADLLPVYADWTVWDFLQGIYFDVGQIVDLLKGLQQTLTAWGNRWDSQDQYLMEWAKRWDALDKSPADLSETNKLLGRLTADVASIRDKYVVGDSLSDMFGALVGDLQVPATAAAIDGIKGAMSTAFPFCIPSVVNLVLFGSVVADPQAPCWEFDIVGNPLVVDFSGFEDFAEVCRWTVRLLFAAALLLNTRKFVYGVGGAY